MDPQEIVDEVTALLGAPATLEDRQFRLIAFCAHDTSIEDSIDGVRLASILGRCSSAGIRSWFEGFGIATATGPLRTPADPAHKILTRVCLPALHRGRVLGYVWLLDEGRIDSSGDGRLEQAMSLAALAGAWLARRVAADPAQDSAITSALGDALSTSRTRRAAGAAELTRRVHAYTIMVIHAANVSLPVPGVITSTEDGWTRALVPLRRSCDLRPAIAVALAAVGETGVHAGVGAARADLAGVRACLAEAHVAERVAALDPAFDAVAAWDDLGAYRLLSGLATDEAWLGVLDAHESLRETAEVFLDRAGNVKDAAERLRIHRQTLYYRISRIEELTGLDLDDGRDRLLLHLAVKRARVRGWTDAD